MTQLTVLDRTEEDILTGSASDEVLESAAMARAVAPGSFSFCTSVYVCPWWSPPAAAGREPQ